MDELAVPVAVVSFAEPALLARFERRVELPFTFYGDPERATYAAFGFGRASVARVWLDPRVWLAYARLLARGRVSGLPTQDTLQLGGDVVTDVEGRVRWIHRSSGPEDHPPVERIVAALRG
jgi:hypothetical protein